MRYRIKDDPSNYTIEAIRYNGKNLEEIAKFIDEDIEFLRSELIVGDYVIKAPSPAMYHFVTESFFKDIYEAIEDT